jgi:hypothetical protein
MIACVLYSSETVFINKKEFQGKDNKVRIPVGFISLKKVKY